MNIANYCFWKNMPAHDLYTLVPVATPTTLSAIIIMSH